MFEKLENYGLNSFFVLFAILALSCSKDNEQPPISIYGQYVVTAIVTDGQFDFLNTGTVSSDLKKQMEDEQAYSFNSNILTLIAGSPDLVNMTLVEPNLLTTLPGNVPLIRFRNVPKSMGVDRESGRNDFTILAPNSVTEEIGRIENMEMLNQFQIKLKVPQRIYDFNNKVWVNTTVNYTFNRLYV